MIDWQRSASLMGCVWAALGIALGTLLIAPWQQAVTPAGVALLYALAAIAVAISYGTGPALLTALLGGIAYAGVFAAGEGGRELLVPALLLLIALSVGQVTTRLRRHAERARQQSRESTELYELTQKLAAATSSEAVLQEVKGFLAATVAAQQFRLHEVGQVAEAEAGLAQECLGRRQILSQPVKGGGFQVWLPLLAMEKEMGVLSFQMLGLYFEATERRAQLEIVATLVATALARVQLAAQMRAAELKHAAEALRGSILAALSHDLRTPLTALVSQAETLLMGKLPPQRQAALLETLRQQALGLSRQMNNLLDMARLSSGPVELKTAWQPIEEVVGAALQQARGQWPQRQFVTQIAPDLPPVNVDAVLLERALWNLLDNAAKYSPPEAPVTVDVGCAAGNLALAVCDAGTGIDAADAARLFAAFQRGQTESHIPGTGLGLSIAHSIVQAHGGSIEATRRAAGGSCFTIRLPLGEPPAFMADEAAV